MKFKHKPTKIEAIFWNGDNIDEIKKFVGEHCIYCDKICLVLDGVMGAIEPGFWIARKDNGTFYPMSDKELRRKYDLIPEIDSETFFNYIHTMQSMLAEDDCQRRL